jgi:DNA uptake protein ComE-like DNA-binding protein
MRLPANQDVARPRSRAQGGSVLIIVLWVSFGLVTLALYFAQSMSFEMKAADQQAAAVEAEQAIAGAARYVTNILSRLEEPGLLPVLANYRAEAVPIGDATFWLIGRSDSQNQTLPNSSPDVPTFGLVDEASKLNLNTATLEMLENLPRMTPELAAAVIDWRDANDDVTAGGAESSTYLRLNPPYSCKNSNFESVAEIRLVQGAYLDVLFGEDANLNGVLDANENDGDASSPADNRDGRLDSGILDYLTVYTHQPVTGTNVGNMQQMAALLNEKFGTSRANQILTSLGPRPATNVLEFFIRSGLSKEDFYQIESSLISSNGVGLVNVNTASEAVLNCIPGIGFTNASTLVSYRRSNNDQRSSVAWVAEALSRNDALMAGPYVTGRTYQFSADIAAVGHHGRGYRRVKYVYDTADGALTVRYRQDLTHLGWALGRRVRETLQLAKEIR